MLLHMGVKLLNPVSSEYVVGIVLILAVDVMCRESKVYWSHTDLNYDVPSTIHCANVNGTNEQVLVDSDLLFVSKLNRRQAIEHSQT